MLTDQPILFFLVLVAAIGIGWLMRGRIRPKEKDTGGTAINDEYFKGLNFLLNEEQDKALEVFMRMVEVDSDTVETHFALGSLFRRRGEVDRAIRIHQNLIARPSLSRQHRQQALYELGEDYMRAGLFDRAESLFTELSQSGTYVAPALRHLMAIYEQQSDWEQAIAVAQRLELVDGRSQRRTIAHYWCELAEAAHASGQHKRAQQLIRKALGADGDSVRAELLSAYIAAELDEPESAAKSYRRVVERAPAFVGEVLPSLQDCFRRMGDAEGLERYLADLRESNPAAVNAIAVAGFFDPALKGKEIGLFIQRYLETRGQPLARLIEQLGERKFIDQGTELESVRDLVRLLLAEQPRYLCSSCGLTGNTLYWQCPSCRGWGTFMPRADLPHFPSASALPDGTGRR